MLKVNFLETINFTGKTIVVGIFEDLILPLATKAIEDKTNNSITKTIKSCAFKGNIGDYEIINSPFGIEAIRIIIIGLGNQSELNELSYQTIGASIWKTLEKYQDLDLLIDCNLDHVLAPNLAFGLLLKSWNFKKYKTDKTNHLSNLTVICSNQTMAENNFNHFNSLLESVFFAREITSEPGNVIYPKILADKCLALSKLGITVEILEKNELQQLGMNALLGVAQGSSKEPYVVVMKLEKGNNQPIALVGKGVCFDSGGISIKPSLNMHEMRYDMAGAAAVIGTLMSLAQQNLPVNAIGVIGLVENMPDGNAQRPGDVVVSMSGKTIEVVDTDAEGRLVLADCLWYTYSKFKPSILIDLGTLTMQTIGSLAHEYAGLFTNNDELADSLTKAGKKSGEQVWRLPIGKIYQQQIQSDIADVKNLGDNAGENGAAAEFLRCFVGDSKWAHLDIAGVAWTDKEGTFFQKGVTGYGVRLFEQFIRDSVVR